MIQIHVEHNHNTKGAGMKRMKQRRWRVCDGQMTIQFPVSTAQVIHAAQGFCGIEWTTHDIAEKLGVEECRVRPAVGWLEHRGMVKRAGSMEIKVTRQRGRWLSREHYSRATYQVVEKGGAPDLVALEMALGFSRAFIPGRRA